MAGVATVLALVPVDRVTDCSHLGRPAACEVNAGVNEAHSGPHGCRHPHIIQCVSSLLNLSQNIERCLSDLYPVDNEN